MDTYDCISDLGYSLAGVSTYVKPTDLSLTGTASLSNGPGTVTSPASGKVFTWTNKGDGEVWTVTAASFNGDSASGGSQGGGPNAGSGSGGNSGGHGAAATVTGSGITTSTPAIQSSAIASTSSTLSAKNASASLEPVFATSISVLLVIALLALLN